MRIGLLGKDHDITVHGREGFRKLAGARVHVGRIVERGGIILVESKRALEELERLLVAVLSHQPIAREINQVLILREHGQHVIHGRDAGDVVAFLHVRDPLDHQLFAGRDLREKRFGLRACRTDFSRIPAVEGDPCPGYSDTGIFLHGRAPVLVAALEVQVLVVFHALLVKLATLCGGSGDGHQADGWLGLGRLGLRALVAGGSE